MSPVLIFKSITLSKCTQFNVTFISNLQQDEIQATMQVRELKIRPLTFSATLFFFHYFSLFLQLTV